MGVGSSHPERGGDKRMCRWKLGRLVEHSQLPGAAGLQPLKGT